MAQGQTRAAWLAQAIGRAAMVPENDNLPLTVVQSRGDPDDQVRVTVRLDRRELEAIDEVAAPMGLTRNEWIKRALRWQLWDRAGVLRLAPVTQAELGKLRKQVLAIGRNINQAVHAMNAANLCPRAPSTWRVSPSRFSKRAQELKTLLFTRRDERCPPTSAAKSGIGPAPTASRGEVSFRLTSGTLDVHGRRVCATHRKSIVLGSGGGKRPRAQVEWRNARPCGGFDVPEAGRTIGWLSATVPDEAGVRRRLPRSLNTSRRAISTMDRTARRAFQRSWCVSPGDSMAAVMCSRISPTSAGWGMDRRQGARALHERRRRCIRDGSRDAGASRRIGTNGRWATVTRRAKVRRRCR